VHGILLAYVPYHEAEDLMQDVFVKALERLPELREARLSVPGCSRSRATWRRIITRQEAYRWTLVQPLAAGQSARPDGVAFAVLDTIRGCRSVIARL